jgi:pimeloyl-ACP methyl ester carboxylesterase
MVKLIAGSRFVTGLVISAGLLAVIAPGSATAEDRPSEPFAEAKRIIEDMQRIVTPKRIQESFEARIGGIDQWVSVRGRDRDNPILLFVHGGPASPALPVSWAFQRPWEEYFTVVQWDQRGAGKTYRANDPQSVAETIRIDRFVEDIGEMIDFVLQRYDKRKVILVAHSWGTIISLPAALRNADRIHAYVGIGQVISVRENERLSYDYALETARRENNQEAIDELEALAPYPGTLTRARIIQSRKWAQHYGGLSAYRTGSAYYFNAPKLSPAYDEADRAAIDQGNVLTLGRILKEWMEVDYRDITEMPFPVVMFMGRHDYTTPSEPTAEWIENVDAPSKQGVWFEHSSHLVPLEEPGKTFLALMNYVRPIAVAAGDGAPIAEDCP